LLRCLCLCASQTAACAACGAARVRVHNLAERPVDAACVHAPVSVFTQRRGVHFARNVRLARLSSQSLRVKTRETHSNWPGPGRPFEQRTRRVWPTPASLFECSTADGSASQKSRLHACRERISCGLWPI